MCSPRKVPAPECHATSGLSMPALLCLPHPVGIALVHHETWPHAQFFHSACHRCRNLIFNLEHPPFPCMSRPADVGLTSRNASMLTCFPTETKVRTLGLARACVAKGPPTRRSGSFRPPASTLKHLHASDLPQSSKSVH